MTEIQDMNLIRKIAWSYAKTTGLEFDELFGVAAVGYARAQNEHDPEKAKWSTWAWVNMSHELNDYLASIRPDPHASRDHEEIGPEEAVSFKEMLTSMGKEAREVCEIVFESPHEFLVQNRPKLSQGRLRDGLRERGWSWPSIRNGMREVKQTLTQMV